MRKFDVALLAALGLFTNTPAFADTISGQVLGAGAPIASSAVTLWAAGAGEPTQLAQSQTDADGRFTLSADGKGADLYVTALGRPRRSQGRRRQSHDCVDDRPRDHAGG
jgi:hypothetical protein